MLAVVLGLGSSLSWGLADYIGGLESRRMAVPVVLVISQGTGLALITVVLLVSGEPAPGAHYVAIAALAGSGSMFALGCFYKALSIGTMSLVAPIAATGATVPVVVGLATGDRPGVFALAGFPLALAGVILCARQPGEVGAAADTARRAVLLALVAAVGFGTYFVAMDEASGASVVWALFTGRLAGTLAVVVFLVATRTRVTTGGGRPRLIVLAGALDIGAVSLYAIGTNQGLLSVLAVLSSLYPVVPVVMGRLWLGERLTGSQQLGVAGALAGVVLIAAG